ncbi:glutamate synthase [Trichinella spiralis]|uniref:glutamate synthase n=1 Tax=Trichinella spiralis TaxID=6334 RepID=UPI0001EFCA2F|nr:glutamate synthase [Trichinella spiralis]
MLLGPQYLEFMRSGGTANVRFLQILTAAVHIPHRCLVSLRHCMQTARNNITDLYKSQHHRCVLACKLARSGGTVGSFMHYVFTQILCYSHAVLDHASMKAEILHFQTCPDRLISLELASGIA